MQNPFLSLHLSPTGGTLACMVPEEGLICDYFPAPEPRNPVPTPDGGPSGEALTAESPAQAAARSAAEARKETEAALLQQMLSDAASRFPGVIHLDRRGHRQGVDATITELGLQDRFALKNPEGALELSVHSAALAQGKAARRGMTGPLNSDSLRLLLWLAPDDQTFSEASAVLSDDTVVQCLHVHITGQTDAARWLALLYTALSSGALTDRLERRLIEVLGDDGLLQAFYSQVQTPEEAQLLRAVRALLKPHDTPMLLRAADFDEEQAVKASLLGVEVQTVAQPAAPEPRQSPPRPERPADPERAAPGTARTGDAAVAPADPDLSSGADLSLPEPATPAVPEPEPIPSEPTVGWSFRRVPYMVGDHLTVVVGPQAQLTGTVLMSAHNVLSLRVNDLTEHAGRHPEVKLEAGTARIRTRAVRRVHPNGDIKLKEALDLLDRHPLLAAELTTALDTDPDSAETGALLRHTLLMTTWGHSEALADAVRRSVSEMHLSAVTLQLGHAYRSPDGHLLAVLRAPAGEVMLTRLDDPTAILEDGSMPYPDIAYDGVELRFQLPEAAPGTWTHLGRLADLLA